MVIKKSLRDSALYFIKQFFDDEIDFEALLIHLEVLIKSFKKNKK